MKPKKILLFPNGNTIVLDGSGNQIPASQNGWLRVFLQYLEQNGIDVTDEDLEISLETVGGHGKIFRPFKTQEGEFNWEVSDKQDV